MLLAIYLYPFEAMSLSPSLGVNISWVIARFYDVKTNQIVTSFFAFEFV